MYGDFDGDGQRDRAYHGYASIEEDSPEETHVGVCLTTGEREELPGSEGTVFDVLDIEPDGRDELLYGGTSASGAGGTIAVYFDGSLSDLFAEFGRSVDVEDGHSGNVDGSQYFAAWGCRDVTGDGVRELNIIRLRQRRNDRGDYVEQREPWKMISYEITGRVAHLVDLKTGHADSTEELDDVAGESCRSPRGRLVRG